MCLCTLPERESCKGMSLAWHSPGLLLLAWYVHVQYVCVCVCKYIFWYTRWWTTVVTALPSYRFWYPIGLAIPSGGCVAQLHETDIRPRDDIAAWLDLTCVVCDHTVAWSLCPAAWDTDIWPWKWVASWLNYMCHLCLSILDPRGVALARLPNWQPPIPSGLQGVLAACHGHAQLILNFGLCICFSRLNYVLVFSIILCVVKFLLVK